MAHRARLVQPWRGPQQKRRTPCREAAQFKRSSERGFAPSLSFHVRPLDTRTYEPHDFSTRQLLGAVRHRATDRVFLSSRSFRTRGRLLCADLPRFVFDWWARLSPMEATLES